MLRHRVVPSAGARHRSSGDRHGPRTDIFQGQCPRRRPARTDAVHIIGLAVAGRPGSGYFRRRKLRRPAQLRRRRAIINRAGRRDARHRQRLRRDRLRQTRLLRHRVVPSAGARHRNSGDRHGLRADVPGRQRARRRAAD